MREESMTPENVGGVHSTMNPKFSQAHFFSTIMPPITPSRLSDVGGHEHNGIWMFKDGSRGRFIAYAGTFMYLDWNVAKWIKVRISPPLKAEELYEIWGDYGSIVNVPKLVFVTTAGAPVSV